MLFGNLKNVRLVSRSSGRKLRRERFLAGVEVEAIVKNSFLFFTAGLFFYESDVTSSVLLSYLSVLDLFAKEQMKFQY